MNRWKVVWSFTALSLRDEALRFLPLSSAFDLELDFVGIMPDLDRNVASVQAAGKDCVARTISGSDVGSEKGNVCKKHILPTVILAFMSGGWLDVFGRAF